MFYMVNCAVHLSVVVAYRASLLSLISSLHSVAAHSSARPLFILYFFCERDALYVCAISVSAQ